jgi:hypothetical protein
MNYPLSKGPWKCLVAIGVYRQWSFLVYIRRKLDTNKIHNIEVISIQMAIKDDWPLLQMYCISC